MRRLMYISYLKSVQPALDDVTQTYPPCSLETARHLKTVKIAKSLSLGPVDPVLSENYNLTAFIKKVEP